MQPRDPWVKVRVEQGRGQLALKHSAKDLVPGVLLDSPDRIAVMHVAEIARRGHVVAVELSH
jgi:hypothetical protein